MGDAVDLVRLRPEEYAEWRALSREGFVTQQVDSGGMPRPEAEEYADSALADLLPDGLASPGMHLWSVRRAGKWVGYLWIRMLPRSGGGSAYVMDVFVEPEARRQGVGRAAMLAGESAARAMGAHDIGLNVFGNNRAAIGLYASLGYAVAVRQMTKRLDDAVSATSTLSVAAASLPAVSLRPMTPERYAGFRTRQEMTCVANIVRAGMLPLPEARAKAADDLASLLPAGLATTGHLLFSAYATGVDPGGPDQEQEIGLVWLQVSDRSDGRYAYGHRLEVRPELRRHGYGHAILVETERLLRAEKVRSVGLQVYDFNASARALYEDVGFTVSSQQMKRRL